MTPEMSGMVDDKARDGEGGGVTLQMSGMVDAKDMSPVLEGEGGLSFPGVEGVALRGPGTRAWVAIGFSWHFGSGNFTFLGLRVQIPKPYLVRSPHRKSCWSLDLKNVPSLASRVRGLRRSCQRGVPSSSG